MEREEVLRYCQVQGMTMLDVGAGPLASIAARDFGCIVISIDLDHSSLKKELRNIRSEGLDNRVHLVQADASDLPYPDESVDIVISYGALHHCPLPLREGFVTECLRVARKKLCIIEYRPSTFPHGSNFEQVDLRWLESRLREIGTLEILGGEEMDIYSCIK
jgi:ubiquinone/menaquinone biosynthesis C-methylase UbiE